MIVFFFFFTIFSDLEVVITAMQNDPDIVQVGVQIEEEVPVAHVGHFITGLIPNKN